MKNVLSLFLITAFFGTTVLFSGGQERGSKQEIQDRFIGACIARRARRRRNGTQSRLHGAAGLHTRWPHVRPSDVPQSADRWPSRPGAVCARGLWSFLRQLSSRRELAHVHFSCRRCHGAQSDRQRSPARTKYPEINSS